jgi:hypothetical protein
VIGERQSLDAELHCLSDQNFRGGGPIKEGKSGVTVELSITGHETRNRIKPVNPGEKKAHPQVGSQSGGAASKEGGVGDPSALGYRI